jgi:hypothetical protein
MIRGCNQGSELPMEASKDRIGKITFFFEYGKADYQVVSFPSSFVRTSTYIIIHKIQTFNRV